MSPEGYWTSPDSRGDSGQGKAAETHAFPQHPTRISTSTSLLPQPDHNLREVGQQGHEQQCDACEGHHGSLQMGQEQAGGGETNARAVSAVSPLLLSSKRGTSNRICSAPCACPSLEPTPAAIREQRHRRGDFQSPCPALCPRCSSGFAKRGLCQGTGPLTTAAKSPER